MSKSFAIVISTKLNKIMYWLYCTLTFLIVSTLPDVDGVEDGTLDELYVVNLVRHIIPYKFNRYISGLQA